MIPLLAWLILGAIVVWISAGFVVESSIRIAKATGIHEAFIGLTVISIGTSLPEISTSVMSAVNKLNGIDASGVALGTNIGSDIVQVTLIMGIVGLIAVIKAGRTILNRDFMIMIGANALLLIMFLNGIFSRAEGWLLVILYLCYLLFLGKKEKVFSKINNSSKQKLFRDACIVATGLVVIIVFADVVVRSAVGLSSAWGVTQSFIGLLIIGVSTALPELTASVRGILKGAPAISLGTLIGSNITNPLLVMGLGAGIAGFTVERNLYTFDLPFILAVYLIVLMMFRRGMSLKRGEAVACIFFYFLYVGLKLSFLL